MRGKLRTQPQQGLHSGEMTRKTPLSQTVSARETRTRCLDQRKVRGGFLSGAKWPETRTIDCSARFKTGVEISSGIAEDPLTIVKEATAWTCRPPCSAGVVSSPRSSSL